MPEVKQLYAYIALPAPNPRNAEEEGGIIAAYTPQAGWMPMVTSSLAVIEKWELVAQDVVNQTGRSVELRAFREEKILKTLSPR